MTSKLAQKAGLKLFEQHVNKYSPEDPVYETYIDKNGKERKRKVCVTFPTTRLDTPLI